MWSACFAKRQALLKKDLTRYSCTRLSESFPAITRWQAETAATVLSSDFNLDSSAKPSARHRIQHQVCCKTWSTLSNGPILNQRGWRLPALLVLTSTVSVG